MTELSREAILAMVPGNKLDVLIQQRIFKQEYPSLEEMKSIAEKQWEVQPHCTHFLMGFDAWKEDGEFMWEYNAPKYSRDIAAAWGVVEKMRENGKYKFGMDSYDGLWNVGFTEGSYFGNQAETAPEAICKASLLAMKWEDSI